MTRIISWNVNGIRAVEKKGMFEWLQKEQPDIFCIQETKAQPDQLDETFHNQKGYHSYFISAEKKGYSGTALYTKEKPVSVGTMGIKEFDSEGRTLVAQYSDFTLINSYFPNSQAEGGRIAYKTAYNEALHKFAQSIADEGKNVIICGDYNVAHKPIDLTHPDKNENNPGYLPAEREWMDHFTESGWVDTFRYFHKEGEQYTWWSYRTRGRERNVGWRIDYFCVNSSFTDRLKDSIIHKDVMGSDHCPIELQLK